MSGARRLLPAVLAAALMSFGAVATAPAAQACGTFDPCPPADDGGGSGDTGTLSDGTQKASYQSPTKSCSVYANGAGMGMYCVSLGGGSAKTLRMRFGDQKLQRCRYDEIPPSIQTPFNANPSKGRYMLMSCLDNIDFDTYSGGPDRSIDLSLVFVEDGTDVADRNNPISEFLWNLFDSDTQMPVPFMRTRPNTTPLVGIPTYFTFGWRDPATKNIVAQGPYAGSPTGGAYREINQNGVVMRARATKIVIDPHQEGVKPATCDPATPYLEGRLPKDQPADACSIVFLRSSASARKYATKAIPDNISDAFYADVRVTWEVTYGEPGGTMRQLGNGFTMRMRQILPVQEVQAPNQPPAVIY